MAKKARFSPLRPSDTMIYETIGGFLAVIQGSPTAPSPFTGMRMSCPRCILIRSANEKDAAFFSNATHKLSRSSLRPSLPLSLSIFKSWFHLFLEYITFCVNLVFPGLLHLEVFLLGKYAFYVSRPIAASCSNGDPSSTATIACCSQCLHT